jgi:ribA/ribD-fused uncharacterized protein
MTAITSFRGEYRWLSNFATSAVIRNGVWYVSSEHAYQAAKATTQEQHDWVARAASCGEAKKRGNKVMLRPDWDEICVGVMEECVRSKFALNPDLRDRLLATGTAKLEEGNNWGDQFWGTVNGIGDNHLGKILMKVRDELRKAR